jgi:hypothetical protein
MMIHQHYIQYHNADKLGVYPTPKTDFRTSVDLLTLDNSVKYEEQFFTSKKLVEKAVGQFCFLIVGKTEKIKKYYLWSYFRIDDFTKDQSKYYHVNGTGFDFQNPILLNDLDNFSDFRNFCGNFGIGFQNIDKHHFCSTLISLANQTQLDIPTKTNTQIFSDDLKLELRRLNEKMQNVSPEKRMAEVEQTLRNDKQIVDLLKKVKKYKCQFPNCDSLVITADGTNYVEVAHIKPVNQGGQSILGNIIVLCPNHHKEFDYGVLKIDVQTDNFLQGQLNGKKFQIEM